ncbi:uncharacterized protein LOC126846270 [Adelges cooleyi]|uniref:uncharacterized protein LOC126846270 n=1 Tax=Adelges cooleyi TaxID=133065 RepID=UPI00217FCB2C|nr:uncharacterized protein LOC126846270 [Adelges cooleyi]
MMRICIITTVLWLSLAVRSSRSAVHPPSPCPDIFAYEGTEPENNRWYGEISLRTDESLVGIRLDIELDRPSDLMVSWMGETSSNDNVKFTILNLNQKLRPGPPVLSRIMVKFNRTTGSPRLRVIRLNGRKICPEDTPDYNSDYDLTTKPQRPQNTKRPDPEFGESPTEQIDEFSPNYNNNNNNQNSNTNNNKEYSSGSTGSSSDKRPVYNNNKETYKPITQPPYGIDQPSNNYNNDNDNRPVYNNNNNNNNKVTVTTTLKPTIRPPFDSGNNLNNKPNTVSLQASTDSNNKDQISGVIDEILSNPSNNKTVIITVINNNDNTQEQNLNNNRPALNNNRPDTNQNNRPGTNQNRPELNANRPSSSSSSSRPVATDSGSGQSRPQNSNNNNNNNNRPSEQQTSSSNQKPNKNQNQDSSYSTTNSQQVSGSTCGEVKLAVPLVTNGQSTHRGQWPWHVALYLIEGINLSYNCGGSLVSRNKVITAAHCVTSKQNDAVYNSSKIVVYLGKYHQLQYSDELGVQTKQVTRINVFPSYNSSNYLGDIAVLTLSSEVELTNYVTPVCMWDEKSNELDDIVGKEGTVVGWGYDENDSPTEELKMAKMPVVSHQTCLWSYPQFYSEFTSDKTFCAGFRNGTSVCNGDSGGGMVFAKNNRWFLRGIVSITVAKEGLRVCDTKHYVVFTDVSKYLDFIKKNITNLNTYNLMMCIQRWRTCIVSLVLWLTWIVRSTSRSAPHPPSPCPEVFEYEGSGPENNRWYGDIYLNTDKFVSGILLEIELDRPSDLMVSWTGETSSKDNIKYIVVNLDKNLKPGLPVESRIMVKFNPTIGCPRVRLIRLNGRTICSENTSITPSPTTTKSSVCGEVKLTAVPLITSGQTTHRGQWPWHVALYLINGIKLSYNCGGSLVSKTKVITAAHCVRQSDVVYNSSKIVIYLGKHHQWQYSDEGVQTKQVTRINVFPYYNNSNYFGDIAILTLSSEVEITDYVKPVCLWEKESNSLDDIVGKEGTVVGWGFDQNHAPTEELMMAKMPVVSHQTCLWSYPDFFSKFTSAKTFCAGFRNGTSVCNGDSGGGMVFFKNNRWFLRGVVSITVAKEGLPVCDTSHYVVFVDVSKYLDFINEDLLH